ncbi:MAG: MarR family winged helix-turn-helix transcriptional regulator [Gemmatimonadales bacterium]
MSGPESDPGAAPHARASRDWAADLLDAWTLLRRASERFDRIAAEEAWPRPFCPARYLILAELSRATSLGLSARRLSRGLSLAPSTLAHHLGVLERSGLVSRDRWPAHDRRKVAVRLTDDGRYALRRLAPMISPAIASP